MKLTITKGLPASGKTTWAKEQVLLSKGHTKRVNKDDLRAMIDAGVWSKDNETEILKIRDKMIQHYLSNGYDVIVDDTNLHPKHEKALGELSQGFQAMFEVKDFTDVPLERCIARDEARPNGVGAKVIKRMYHQFLKPKGVIEPYTPPPYNPDLPNCIIVDIDGTLAHGNGRSAYDYSKVGEDILDENVARLVRREFDTPEFDRTYVVIVSGRDDSCMGITEQWLTEHSIPYDEIYMRKTGDDRNDAIVKKEVYEEWIKPRYNVLYVLDDRDRVVKMWREQGLKVLQVAGGDF
jgi:predicted kinase